MESEMSTYKIIDYVKTGNIYIAVFSHGSKEHQVSVTAVLNTDGTVHIEHTKDAISNAIIDFKEQLDSSAPSNSGSIIGSTFEVNAERSHPSQEAESAEEL